MEAADPDRPGGEALRTRRLVLRAVEAADAAFVRRLLNEPTFLRNIGDRGVRTVAQARVYIRDVMQASYRKHGFAPWIVELADGNTPIGVCGLIRRAALDAPDIGFALLPEFHAQGYASEAAAAAFRHARKTLGLKRILGVVAPSNRASVRVLQKLGLTPRATIRLPGDATDLTLMAWDG